jgi:hypothetical protein
MKDKDAIILESLYDKVIEEAKTKSKKQVGYLLSNKVSPLTSKQKKKLKKELHSGEVKVKNESSRPIGNSGTDSEIELDWTDEQDPVLNGYWVGYYDYSAGGSRSSGSWDEPPSSDINVDIDYLKIVKVDEEGNEQVVYDNQNMKELKVSNPDLYRVVSAIHSAIEEKEYENESNYEDDSYEQEYTGEEDL